MRLALASSVFLVGCAAAAPDGIVGRTHAPYLGRPAYLVARRATVRPRAELVEDVPAERADEPRKKHTRAERPGIAIGDLRRVRTSSASTPSGGELTVAAPADDNSAANPPAVRPGGVVVPIVNGSAGTAAPTSSAPTSGAPTGNVAAASNAPGSVTPAGGITSPGTVTSAGTTTSAGTATGQPGATSGPTSIVNPSGAGSTTNTNPSPSTTPVPPSSTAPAPGAGSSTNAAPPVAPNAPGAPPPAR